MKRCTTCEATTPDDQIICQRCGAGGFAEAPPPANRGTRSLNGFGTTLYGKRHFRPDGSFQTTEFVIAAFVPLWPRRTIRIRTTTPVWDLTHVDFFILEQVPLDVRQVASVALYAYPLFGFVAGTNLLPDGGIAQLICICAGGLMLPIPWLLRRRAIKNLTKE